MHVGAGRTGFSTGAGPVGYYTTVGGGRSRSGGRSVTASARQLQEAAKHEQAKDLLTALEALTNLHRQEFLPAQRPIAPPPPVPSLADLEKAAQGRELEGIGLFKRAERAAAKARAADLARQQHRQALAVAQEQQAAYQAQLDDVWARLLANEEDTVIRVVAEAFEDNEASAAPVGVRNGGVTIVVLVPKADTLPDRIPDTTPAGNLTLKKLTKTQASALYNLMVAGHIIVTAKEAFAVAPGLTGASIIALRDAGHDSYGQPRVECILACHIARNAFDGVRWGEVDAFAVLRDTSDSDLIDAKGAAAILQPVDLSKAPEIADVIAAVDLEELGA